MNKRQVNTIFKKVVKVIKEGNFNTLEQIEDAMQDLNLEYCHGEDGFISYSLGKYEGKITKKDINEKDFKEIDETNAYMDIAVNDSNIEVDIIIHTYYFDKWNYKHDTHVSIYNEIIE